MTPTEGALSESDPDADTLIEDEALALPQARCFRDLFEVTKDASLQVIHLVDPL